MTPSCEKAPPEVPTCCDVVQTRRDAISRVRAGLGRPPTPPPSAGPAIPFPPSRQRTDHHVTSCSPTTLVPPTPAQPPIACMHFRHPPRSVSTTTTTTNQHHRMSRPLPTEHHLYTRGSVQRYSHRRVAAHRLRNLRRLEGLSTAPKTGKCRLLCFYDLCAVEVGDRGLGKGLSRLRLEGFSASCQRHGFFWRRGFAGRAGTSCHFITNLLSSSSRCPFPVACGPCPKSQGCSARSLGGRESCLPQGSRFGNAPLLLSDVLTCDRLERSVGHGR